jgi:hypothetical protein
VNEKTKVIDMDKRLERDLKTGAMILGYAIEALGGLALATPKMALNAAGFCYKKRFELTDMIIERPDSFTTKDEKKAFENVGEYVTDFLARDMMLVYTDSSLTRKGDIWGHDKVSLEAWHKALSYFAEKGAIEEKWSFSMPSYLDGKETSYKFIPCWGPNGEELARPKENTFLGGLAPKDGEFIPSALTTEQKNSLIGKEYSRHNASFRWRTDEPLTHTVTEKDFEKVYYRNRNVISEKSKESDLERFGKIMKDYAKLSGQ